MAGKAKGKGKSSRKAYRVYVGCRGGSIHAYDMNMETGALTEIGTPVEQDKAGAFLAPSADGNFLYGCAKAGAHKCAAAAFAIDQTTGALRHINTTENEIHGNCHISLGFLSKTTMVPKVAVFAAYKGGGVNIVKINADGSVAEAEPGSSIMHSGGSGVHPEKDAQGVPHPHSCFVDPTGRRAIVSDLGQDKVYVYDIDMAAGKLKEHSVLNTAPGAGPRHVCFHPRGRYVYGINELDCTINVYKYDDRSGDLGPILHTVSALPEGYNNHDPANAKNAEGNPASGPNREGQTNACADIHVTPDGRFLYGSNRGHDSLVCFSIQKDGSLQLVGFTPTKGTHPRAFGIHPSGNWLFVANQDSDNIVTFKLDRKTGELTQTGSPLLFPEKHGPRCIQFAPMTVLKKPNFKKVSQIEPEAKGLNLFVKVVKTSPLEGADAGSDVVLGDDSAVVTLRARGDQVAKCEVGKILRIQNASTFMDKGFIRLKVDQWGVLAQATDHEDIEPNSTKDVSATEYERE